MHAPYRLGRYVFLLSGMSVDEREEYSGIVLRLGGEVLDAGDYENCTHLVWKAGRGSWRAAAAPCVWPNVIL